VTTPALPATPELRRRLAGRPLLLLLDIDGTLSPIAPRPEYAIVPGATQHVLNALASTPDVHVAVVTGRAAEDGRRLVCTDGAWVIGNHGIEVAAPGRTPSVREDVARFGDQITEAAERAKKIASTEHGVIVENKQWTLSVHYRLAHPRIVPDLTAKITNVARELGLKVTSGKEVLELRPPIEVHKGTAAIELAEALGALNDAASLFVAGDDRTDEDMFRSVRARTPQAVTVRVGSDSALPETDAEFSVADTDAMRALLEDILAQRRG
jgi:trehalose-phosphatase